MPRGDGTGPDGFGPMTGRALGYCAGYSSPGFTKGRGMGLGRGRGRGRGRGFRRRYWSPSIPIRDPYVEPPYAEPVYRYSEEDELEGLKRYAENLKKELENIESRIQELSD